MHTKRLLFCVLAFVTTLANFGYCDELEDQIDKLFENVDSTHTPGVSVAVLHKGKLVYHKAFGMASLELGVPNGLETVFRIGSVSKQFTAACIAMLVRDGKLSLDDPVTNYVPALPKEVYGSVKIRHMIHHTSGIRDSEALYPVMGINYSRWFDNGDLLKLLAKQKSLDFEPGSEATYSNSAYTLLAMVVEKVSGKSFPEFISERIFSPLGMEASRIQSRFYSFIPNRAAGYANTQSGYVNWMTNNQLVGHDAQYSSSGDMINWARALLDDKLGDGVVKMMTSTDNFNDGSEHTYGYGLIIDSYKGLPVWFHDGWYVGYTAFMIAFPEQQLAITCLANNGNYGPQSACFKIADIILSKELEASLSGERALVPQNDYRRDEKLLQRLAGKYTNIDFGGGSVELLVKDGALWMEGEEYALEPSPYHPDEFIIFQSRERLRILSGKQPGEAVILDSTSSIGSFGRHMIVDGQSFSDDEKAKLTGSYFSPEIDSEISIAVTDGVLAVGIGSRRYPITRVDGNRFVFSRGGFVMHRDADGSVRNLGLSRFGFRNVLFDKR